MRQATRAAVAHALLLATICGAAASASAQTQDTGVAPVPQGASLLNPAISVIGWFQGEAGDQNSEEGTAAFEFREVEVGLQANVDPYSRADFFVAVTPDGVDIEEATLTLFSLPAGFMAKLGKFRSNFGKFNRTHPPETPFADRPLAAERFLGEEGLAPTGVSASWLAPLPFYLSLDAEVTTTPEAHGHDDEEEAEAEMPTAFEPYRGKDLLYLGRVSTFVDLSEAMNVTVGGTYADGANGSAQTDSLGPVEALRAQLVGADVTFRWKDPARAIYRSLLAQVEWMERSAETLGGPDEKRQGAFAWVDFQFARRWHVGARYDWSDALGGLEQDAATGALGFVTFTPSEFSLVSLQGRRQELEDGSSETRWFLKTTFNIGPHGQHPF
ncbi:MAG TPA: hypothetical protein VFP58_12310 [Candidatus Eisenbacteria bacterium]|nr:hypothetical protein [Candidatus Eisenbacteria bacterium]